MKRFCCCCKALSLSISYLIVEGELAELVDVEAERGVLKLESDQRTQVNVLGQRLAIPRLRLQRLLHQTPHVRVLAHS